MSIGDRIKALRIKNDLSQIDLAEKIGSTKQAIYKYEKGIVTNIPSDKLQEIARALHTTPAYLMGWEEEADHKETESPVDVALKNWLDSASEDEKMALLNLLKSINNK